MARGLAFRGMLFRGVASGGELSDVVGDALYVHIPQLPYK